MFHAIIDLVPTFEEVLLKFVDDTGLLGEFIAKVSYYMRFELSLKLIHLNTYIAQLSSRLSTTRRYRQHPICCPSVHLA
jgi:hypothetical protein